MMPGCDEFSLCGALRADVVSGDFSRAEVQKDFPLESPRYEKEFCLRFNSQKTGLMWNSSKGGGVAGLPLGIAVTKCEQHVGEAGLIFRTSKDQMNQT